MIERQSTRVSVLSVSRVCFVEMLSKTRGSFSSATGSDPSGRLRATGGAHLGLWRFRRLLGSETPDALSDAARGAIHDVVETYSNHWMTRDRGR